MNTKLSAAVRGLAEEEETELLIEEFAITELEDRLGMELPVNRNCYGCTGKG